MQTILHFTLSEIIQREMVSFTDAAIGLRSVNLQLKTQRVIATVYIPYASATTLDTAMTALMELWRRNK